MSFFDQLVFNIVIVVTGIVFTYVITHIGHGGGDDKMKGVK